MTRETADEALDLVFQSPNPAIKIEFQGGEPLLNFDLIRYVVDKAERRGQAEGRDLEFVITTTLALATDEILEYCRDHHIYLSSSLDGPEDLHNKNRPRPGRDSHARLCVQQRLACSAGDRPAGVRVRRPVAWIAGWRETKTLKPIDDRLLGGRASHWAVMKMNVDVASKVKRSEGRARNREGEGKMGSRKLTDTAISLRRGGSDGTVARTC